MLSEEPYSDYSSSDDYVTKNRMPKESEVEFGEKSIQPESYRSRESKL